MRWEACTHACTHTHTHTHALWHVLCMHVVGGGVEAARGCTAPCASPVPLLPVRLLPVPLRSLCSEAPPEAPSPPRLRRRGRLRLTRGCPGPWTLGAGRCTLYPARRRLGAGCSLYPCAPPPCCLHPCCPPACCGRSVGGQLEGRRHEGDGNLV